MKTFILAALTAAQIFSLNAIGASVSGPAFSATQNSTSTQTSADTALAQDMLKMVPQNIPMGDFEQFRQLMTQYFDAYTKMSKPERDAYQDEFLQALNQNSKYEKAKLKADAAKKKTATTPVDTIAMDAAESALLNNLLHGTVSDFNQKIVTLAGVYVFDPQSAPAIYHLFKTLNENDFTDDYFRGLYVDARPSEQFRRGLVAGAELALLITVLDPATWRTLGEKLSATRGRLQSGLTFLQSILPKGGSLEGAAAAEQIETGFARTEANFRSLGLGGVKDRTDARLLQDAMGGDAEAEQELAARLEARKARSNVTGRPMKLKNAENDRWYTFFVGQNPRNNFLWMMKALGFAGSFGAVDVGYHAGIQKLYNHIYSPINPVFEKWNFIVQHSPPFISKRLPQLDPTTRLVPLDEGALRPGSDEHELLDTAYNALAALKFSCQVDSFSKSILSLKQATPQELENAKSQLVEDLVQYNVMRVDASYYLTKQCVPKAIRYDFGTHQIVMNLPEGQDSIRKSFACEKYAAGFSGNCLAVSLEEVKSQLNQTYSAIQALSERK